VAEASLSSETVKRLAAYFHRNGYVRRLDAVRRIEDGQLYKKGAEVRLVAQSSSELAEIRRLLKRAGFKCARPFAKARQWRQPVYGVAEVARFLDLVGERKRRPTARTRNE
jgi:hypothetical protein